MARPPFADALEANGHQVHTQKMEFQLFWIGQSAEEVEYINLKISIA